MVKFFNRLVSLFGFNHLFDASSASMRVGYQDPNAENSARLAKYDKNWVLYHGSVSESSAPPPAQTDSNVSPPHAGMGLSKEDGTKDMPKTNWLSRNINKINWWAFGRPYNLYNEEYQEVMELTMKCWGPHILEKLSNMGQFGSICGDAFLMALPKQKDNPEIRFDENAIKFVASVASDVNIAVLNPSFCTPVYDPFDKYRLQEVHIQIPMRSVDENGSWHTQFQFQRITDEKVYTAILDASGKPIAGTEKEIDNPIGKVYAIHIRNKPFGDSRFGDDDIREASRLNEVYNEKLMSAGQIIDYHGAPITVIYGARAKNLTKGPNKVWGNMPKDGKVEHLELNTDLPAMNEYLTNVKENLHVMMGVPEIAQGTEQAISNTTGVALHTMYMPLIERVVEKWGYYSPWIIRLHVLCVRWLDYLDLLKKDGSRGRRVNILSRELTEDDYDKMENESEIHWELPLPKDRLIEAQIQQTLVSARLRDRKTAMRSLGDKNPDKTIEAIKEDRDKGILPPATNPRNGNAVDNEGEVDDDDDSGRMPTSGAEATTGENTNESDRQRGRPRGS